MHDTIMGQVSNFFRKLLDTDGFPPRWHCGTGWDDFTGWFYIVSDLIIWASYFAIPLIIIRYITKRQDIRFTRIYFLFASFILACGTTHFIDALLFWHPVYRLSALVRFITAMVSMATVLYLIKLLPQAFSLKTAQELEAEVRRKEAAEEQLKIQNNLLNDAQAIARMGYWQWDVLADKIVWSDNLFRIYGMEISTKPINYEEYVSRLHPEDRDFITASVKRAFDQKKFEEFYHRVVLPDGQVRTVHSKGDVVVNEKGEVVRMIGTAQDVTEQKKVEQELLSKSQDLEATNIELQKFASIASHDLREPLRKIITFTSMLDKEYVEKTAKADVYLEKITSSAERMQQLIEDILDFSRLSSGDFHFEKIDLNRLLEQVLLDMEVNITVTNAQIKIDHLPVIDGNASQLSQLFQNLISNAIKFRKENTQPEIHIYAETIYGSQLNVEYLKGAQYSVLSNPRFWAHEKFCKIYVSDQGIGFDEIYLDKIFTIFQRLHGRGAYEGTGIGLAICKKVVDIHHGTIAANSQPDKGATFIIILPVSQRNFRGIDK